MHIVVDAETLLSAAATLIGLLSLAFIPLVLVRRKDSASAIAWILTLVFVPLVGIVLFWFLGRDRMRRPARAKLSATVVVRGRISEIAVGVMDAQVDALVAKQPEEQRGLMRLASRLSRTDIVPGNDVQVLVGAPDTYNALIDAIDQARDHVHLEYYILRADVQGRRFLDALVRAVRRGVRVRLLFDAFGSRSLRRRVLAPLVRAGGYVAPFLPLDPIRRAWAINLRNHRKLTIVDGEVGFMGGVNVGDEFIEWRDVHLRVRGPAVAQLQATFVEDWFFAARHDLAHPAFFPALEEVGRSVVQFVASAPDGTAESIHRIYFAAIASARDRVYITTPYFVPDRAILVALQSAALRGVDVRLILPRRSNHRVTFHAGRSFYEELLEAGVRVHEYLPGMVHTKTMVVDGRFATVGSANLDTRSFRLNFELNAVLYDADVVGRLERLFMEDLGKTDVVELDRWRERPVRLRLVEGFGRLCAPLL